MFSIQIAGVVARRIVFWKHVGDRVQKGESGRSDSSWFAKVDILIPAGTEVSSGRGRQSSWRSSPIGVISKKWLNDVETQTQGRRNPKRTPTERPVLIPSLFTIGNMFCAYFPSFLRSKVTMTSRDGDWRGRRAGRLDGRIARMTQTASEFGVQLDSIADVLTFGLLPPYWHSSGDKAKLQYGSRRYAIRDVCLRTSPSLELDCHIHLHDLWRMAAGSISRVQIPEASGHRAQTSLCRFAHTCRGGIDCRNRPFLQISDGQWDGHVLVFAGPSGRLLMASTIRYPSFKELHF